MKKSQEKKPRKPRKKKATQSKGLGDTVDKILTFTGIKQAIEAVAGKCDACEKRKAFLNKSFPYLQLNPIKGKLRPDQRESWQYFKEQNYKTLKDDQMDLIQQIYCETFHTRVDPCRNCPGASEQWKALIDRIDNVYEKSES